MYNDFEVLREARKTFSRCKIRSKRPGIVEPVFANLCVQKRMHRFTLRSKRKVDGQWSLFARVHNIGKIHTFGALI